MALLKRKRSGLSDPMSVVTNFVNACNRHDAEGVSACLHPDFDSIQPMYPARNFRGADQVRRNWQAIFDAEPGFRLTVLRTAAADSTVWLELHGAGRDAEVAGVFVMGILGDRIRWARIYSALVEGSPVATDDGTVPAPAPLREVPPLHEDAGSGEVAAVAVAATAAAPEEEELIAPVVDIDGNWRSFRRRSRRKGRAGPAATQDPDIEEAAVMDPDRDREPDPEPVSAATDGPIDPENLVDLERLTGSDPLPGPEGTDEPDEPAGPGSDRDPKQTLAAEATVVPPESVAEPDVMVETMVAVEPEATVEPEEAAKPEPVVAIIEEPAMSGVVEPIMAVVLQPELAVEPQDAVEPDVETDVADSGPPPPGDAVVADPWTTPESKER